MTTKALRHHVEARSAPAAKRGQARVPKEPPPSAKLVASRLAALDLTSTPWFRQDIDLSPPDGGPEVFGMPIYRAPTRRG
jgi:hypothetical protein